MRCSEVQPGGTVATELSYDGSTVATEAVRLADPADSPDWRPSAQPPGGGELARSKLPAVTASGPAAAPVRPAGPAAGPDGPDDLSGLSARVAWLARVPPAAPGAAGGQVVPGGQVVARSRAHASGQAAACSPFWMPITVLLLCPQRRGEHLYRIYRPQFGHNVLLSSANPVQVDLAEAICELADASQVRQTGRRIGPMAQIGWHFLAGMATARRKVPTRRGGPSGLNGSD